MNRRRLLLGATTALATAAVGDVVYRKVSPAPPGAPVSIIIQSRIHEADLAGDVLEWTTGDLHYRHLRLPLADDFDPRKMYGSHGL